MCACADAESKRKEEELRLKRMEEEYRRKMEEDKRREQSREEEMMVMGGIKELQTAVQYQSRSSVLRGALRMASEAIEIGSSTLSSLSAQRGQLEGARSRTAKMDSPVSQSVQLLRPVDAAPAPAPAQPVPAPVPEAPAEVPEAPEEPEAPDAKEHETNVEERFACAVSIR